MGLIELNVLYRAAFLAALFMSPEKRKCPEQIEDYR